MNKEGIGETYIERDAFRQSLVELSSRPLGLRVLVRRERLPPLTREDAHSKVETKQDTTQHTCTNARSEETLCPRPRHG